MKGTILALSFNQLPICVQEEVLPPDKIIELYMKYFRRFFCIFHFVCWEFFYFVAARAEIGEFVEYDLDNEDEDWLSEFNEERDILTPEM